VSTHRLDDRRFGRRRIAEREDGRRAQGGEGGRREASDVNHPKKCNPSKVIDERC